MVRFFLNSTQTFQAMEPVHLLLRPHHSDSVATDPVQSELTVRLTCCCDDSKTPSNPTRCLGKNCCASTVHSTCACHRLYFSFYETVAAIPLCCLCPGRCPQQWSNKQWSWSSSCCAEPSGEAASCWRRGDMPWMGQQANAWWHDGKWYSMHINTSIPHVPDARNSQIPWHGGRRTTSWSYCLRNHPPGTEGSGNFRFWGQPASTGLELHYNKLQSVGFRWIGFFLLLSLWCFYLSFQINASYPQVASTSPQNQQPGAGEQKQSAEPVISPTRADPVPHETLVPGT